ncbi:MAG TPA: HAD family hydrolase [Longimicrobiales bacterium]|nr:HAD family hydrolase [Longimicrobiales bacterium]
MIELVLVDFDDTLVNTGPRFQNARRALVLLLQEAGFDEGVARDMLFNRVDPEMRARYGLGPKRMEPSFVATYDQLCALYDMPADPDIRQRAAELGRGCYGPPPAFDGALDALRRLSESHPTVVYTQSGDLEYQLSCVRGAGIIDIVTEHRVRITDRKDTGMFRQTLDYYGVRQPDAAWMIGNSLRSDINPALEAGANAILVETEDPWEYDLVEPVATTFRRVRTFPDAVALLL